MSAHPAAAASLGTVWATVSALSGTFKKDASVRARLRDLVLVPRRREEVAERLRDRARAAILTGTAAVAAGLVLGALVSLGWTTARVARSPGADAGEVVASAIAAAAFGPNLAGASVDLAMGASVDVRADVVVGRDRIAREVDLSLLRTRESGLPPVTLLLATVPAVACAAGGRACARRGSGLISVVLGACVFASVLTVLALFGRGEVIVGGNGARASLSIAPDAGEVAIAALAWGVVLGCLGWVLGRQHRNVAGPHLDDLGQG